MAEGSLDRLPAACARRTPSAQHAAPARNPRLALALKIGSGVLLAAVTLVVIGLLAVTVGPRLLPYQALVVRSGSMSPNIPTGSIVFYRSVPASKVKVGDVIVFNEPGQTNKRVTHRVYRIDTSATGRYFVTKGDANGDRRRLADSGGRQRLARRLPRAGRRLPPLRPPVDDGAAAAAARPGPAARSRSPCTRSGTTEGRNAVRRHEPDGPAAGRRALRTPHRSLARDSATCTSAGPLRSGTVRPRTRTRRSRPAGSGPPTGLGDADAERLRRVARLDARHERPPVTGAAALRAPTAAPAAARAAARTAGRRPWHPRPRRPTPTTGTSGANGHWWCYKLRQHLGDRLDGVRDVHADPRRPRPDRGRDHERESARSPTGDKVTITFNQNVNGVSGNEGLHVLRRLRDDPARRLDVRARRRTRTRSASSPASPSAARATSCAGPPSPARAQPSR